MDDVLIKRLRSRYGDPANEPVTPEFMQLLDMFGRIQRGIPTLLGAPFHEEAGDVDIALIGVPFDLGVSSRPGARFGPRAVRESDFLIGPWHHTLGMNPFNLCRIGDLGDVPLVGFDLAEGIEIIERRFASLHAANIDTITVGGDHSITYPILKSLGRDRPLGLVHFDAHCDTMGEVEGTRLHHGAPFRNAVLEGVLDPERTIQIGIRGGNEPFWRFSHDAGMTVIYIEDFMAMGVDGVIRKAREVVGEGPVYVSFDIDVLDPAYAPGTGTPEVGGISSREALALLRGLRGLDIVGGDVVEIAPTYDPGSSTAQVGKQMLFEILCLTAEARTRRQRL